MPANKSKYTVNVLLDPENLPSEDKSVIYDNTNKEFVLGDGGGSANEIEVGPLSDDSSTLNIGDFQLGMFSRTNDNSSTTVSGSSGVAIIGIGSIGGDIRQNEFRISGSANGGVDDIKTFGVGMPLRIQGFQESGEVTNYEFEKYSTVPNYLEHVQIVRPGSISAGQDSTFMTISLNDVGNYIGSGSYEYSLTGVGRPVVSSSYNYIKVEHLAYKIGTTARTQKCTHHFAWQRNASTPFSAADLRASSIEDVRSPEGRAIIDPFRTTGSFNSNGDFVLSVYLYNVDYAQHVVKYTLM